MASWQISLERLVTDRSTALIRYGFLLCGDRGEAEDLMQDALLRTFAAGKSELDAETAEGYVRRAMLNAYVDGFRRRRRWAAVRHLFDPPASSGDGEAMAADRLDVEAALWKLRPRQRACLVLRYYEDMTVPMIADQLSLSQGAVKRYLSDATKEITSVLGLADTDDRNGVSLTPTEILTELSTEVVEVVGIDSKRGRF
ncbi:sigma-70 family RNA polymerase sigma factor [Actinotalea sp. K2]|uniref:sigma-70 family RNA polymerase sigma factor n=1 Tax=Actinotalea sp. K2 TaxID=2939438 RepID=UPI00201732F6|nr:sigma-70 family RNA polymerase sigma factor [Actinotalea sp. K2]MCL3859560.1 sigma-70 family RNA polymerase sigma factor [Actinotalea sp. K2]